MVVEAFGVDSVVVSGPLLSRTASIGLERRRKELLSATMRKRLPTRWDRIGVTEAAAVSSSAGGVESEAINLAEEKYFYCFSFGYSVQLCKAN